MKLVIPEREIQKSGIAILESFGLEVFRRNVGAMTITDNGKRRHVRMNAAGMADTWAIGPRNWEHPLHWEIEFKRMNEYPTLKQAEWLHKMAALGCPAFWIDNTKTLFHVTEAIIRGGRVVYSNDNRRYGKQWGPSADYMVCRVREVSA